MMDHLCKQLTQWADSVDFVEEASETSAAMDNVFLDSETDEGVRDQQAHTLYTVLLSIPVASAQLLACAFQEFSSKLHC